MKKILIPILSVILTIFIFRTPIYASTADFVVDTTTHIIYTTGEDSVTVKNIYTKTIENDDYYFPASGEKTFHIPDNPQDTEEEVADERQFKKDSITVTDTKGNSLDYTVEENASGLGMYVNIPNYKQTTATSPYNIVFSYRSHDYVQKIGEFVTLQGPALPDDITFEQTDSGTTTEYNYDLSIVVDENIPSIAKIYPSSYSTTEDDGLTYYNFSQADRIGNSPTIEFGESVTYQFKLTYQTPKTDSFIPEQYSNIFNALSTNIYELSLPREFSETSQKVYFTNVSPYPTDIYQDEEGNIIASFEVPANEITTITVEGYIVVNQDPLSEYNTDWDIPFDQYLEEVSSTDYLSGYLSSTKYWEVDDAYIQQEAANILNTTNSILDVIKADYQYVNDKLEYDESKATSENERIGAKAALQGGASVCMEYADSMIAILRAQGIPSRAALGYANLTEQSSDSQVRHQWVQVWIPDYGWLSVDPTLESANMRIGQSIDRVLWEVFNGDSLSNIRVFSADNINSVTTSGYSIDIYAVDSEGISFSTLKTYIDLVPDKNYTSIDDLPQNSEYNAWQWLNTFLKTTTLGKSLLITAPILILLVILTVVIMIVVKIVKKAKAKKKLDESIKPL